MSTPTNSTTSLTSELTMAIGSVGTALSSALAPVTDAETAAKSVAEAVTEITKLIEARFAAHNTPAMVANAEAIDEEKEVSKDNAAEAKAEKGDESEVEKRLS